MQAADTTHFQFNIQVIACEVNLLIQQLRVILMPKQCEIFIKGQTF